MKSQGLLRGCWVESLPPGSIENSCTVMSANSGDAQRALLPSLKTPPQVWSLVKRGDS